MAARRRKETGRAMENRKKPELLIPAGSLEVLKTAVIFGADAVYIGGEAFGLRAKAKNFSPEEMAEGIVFAHARGVKVYVTANVLAHNEDLEEAAAYFAGLRDMEPERCDALIISDPGMFALAREVWPQAEIRAIRERIPEGMEIESFVQGSMCISYSGRCLLSNYFTGRDANQGACTHPCRWKYALVEETRPGEYLPVYENERGTYIFNSKDLCMIEHIPELAEAGIDSLKVEGRMKTALYIATVARTYRKAIDDYFASEASYRANMDWYRAEIAKCTYRQFTTGFYFGKPGEEAQIYDNSTYVNEYIFLGIVEETASGALPWDDSPAEEPSRLVRFEQRNKFSVGDSIEIMKPDGRNVPVLVEAMYDQEGQAMESCPHARQKIWARLSGEASPCDLLRVANLQG